MITIVTPSFNSEKFLVSQYQRLKPILSESINWLIVDDCSQDRTTEVVNDFMSPFVTYHKLDVNSGPSRARHVGANIANTKYIFFLDADDVLFNESFLNFYDFLKENNKNNIHYFYAPSYAASSASSMPDSFPQGKLVLINKPTDFIINSMPNYSSLAVDRLFFIENIKENRLSWGEDIVSYLQLGNYGIGLKWIKPISCYVITGDGRGSSLALNKRIKLFAELLHTSSHAPKKINSFCFSLFLIVRYSSSYVYKKLRG